MATPILRDFQQRDLVADVTAPAEFAAHLAEAPRLIYVGFDPTADSLHVGNLVPLLGTGISFTEFTYQVLQAYDFLALHERYGCTAQMGGSDQWGNITAGTELIRKVRGAAAYGLTLPLVAKADGTKFGKTESGTVWLDPARTSAYEMYQFWLNTPDADVMRFLKTFTFLPIEEIEALGRQVAEAPEKREAPRVLAREVTRLVHGDEGLRGAEARTAALFGGAGDVSGPPDAVLQAAAPLPVW